MNKKIGKLELNNVLTITNTNLSMRPINATFYLEYKNITSGTWYISSSYFNDSLYEIILYSDQISDITKMQKSLFKIRNKQFAILNLQNCLIDKMDIDTDFLSIDDIGFVISSINGAFVVKEYYNNDILVGLKICFSNEDHIDLTNIKLGFNVLNQLWN